MKKMAFLKINYSWLRLTFHLRRCKGPPENIFKINLGSAVGHDKDSAGHVRDSGEGGRHLLGIHGSFVKTHALGVAMSENFGNAYRLDLEKFVLEKLGYGFIKEALRALAFPSSYMFALSGTKTWERPFPEARVSWKFEE